MTYVDIMPRQRDADLIQLAGTVANKSQGEARVLMFRYLLGFIEHPDLSGIFLRTTLNKYLKERLEHTRHFLPKVCYNLPKSVWLKQRVSCRLDQNVIVAGDQHGAGVGGYYFPHRELLILQGRKFALLSESFRSVLSHPPGELFEQKRPLVSRVVSPLSEAAVEKLVAKKSGYLSGLLFSCITTWGDHHAELIRKLEKSRTGLSLVMDLDTLFRYA